MGPLAARRRRLHGDSCALLEADDRDLRLAVHDEPHRLSGVRQAATAGCSITALDGSPCFKAFLQFPPWPSPLAFAALWTAPRASRGTLTPAGLLEGLVGRLESGRFSVCQIGTRLPSNLGTSASPHDRPRRDTSFL